MAKPTESMIQLDYAEEMRNSFRDYALSVIISRALPDVRDGLKPVQRRILYTMKELGLAPDKPHKKSARIVGDAMGKYHPHGDRAIYDALVHLTEDYSLSVPLVDGHGNFGSIDGDGAAAMRYTEARLSKVALTMLENLEKGLVNFQPNYDESEMEPSVLPSTLPNLLLNGTMGIAVGMATSVPPHNPVETIDGTIAMINNPSISIDKLMEYVPGPDFPTGGIVTNAAELRDVYSKGEGKIRIRAKTTIEKGDNGRLNIVVTEVPYTIAGNKTKLVDSLVNLMRDKTFEEMHDVRDESSKEGVRIVIEVKKDRDPENLLNGLYRKTSMEDTLSVNFLAVKDKQPIVFNLKSMLQEFIDFQVELYTREYEHLLQKAEARHEVVDGLIRATDVIDLIIEILRGSQSVTQAKACLIDGEVADIRFRTPHSALEAATLRFTERQADAILSMPLSRLIGLEILKLREEKSSLMESMDEYRKTLGDEKELFKVMKNRLREYRKAFAKPRRTELANLAGVDYKAEKKVEDVYILIDRFGYAKSLDTASFGRLSEDTAGEYPHVVQMENTDKLCLFTAEGNLYQVKADAIPKCKIKDKGVLIHTLCKIGKEDVLTYSSFANLFESLLLFTTKGGYIKLVSGAEFDTNRSVVAATKLAPGDALVGIEALSAGAAFESDRKVVLLTDKGLSLGFPLGEVNEFKKGSRGVKAITLDNGDAVAFATTVEPADESFQYNGKTWNPKKVRNRKRGAKGQKATLT